MSENAGLVAFDTQPVSGPNDDATIDKILDRQDAIYSALASKLQSDPRLTKRRKLIAPITIISIHPTIEQSSSGSIITNMENLSQALKQELLNQDAINNLEGDVFKIIRANIERTTSLRIREPRTEVTKTDSKGALLKIIEGKIANLDMHQQRAAIEFPIGPQRIRGLAGSGKTIVLAMKAAYLHSRHPEWRIVLTFYSKSLYQQLREHIKRFTIDLMKDEPNWEKLEVLHAWGSASTWGVYADIAQAVGAPIRSFGYAKQNFTMENAFRGVCDELLTYIKNSNMALPKLYDVILIDEAQDLPPSFFELVYLCTSDRKSVVYAYDELQTLNDVDMKSPEELFGQDAKGNANVRLTNKANKPKQDITLPVCYRNTPWNLTSAHGLGFGVERQMGLLQMFAMPSTWKEIGYDVSGGTLRKGRQVALERSVTATPNYFYELLSPNDAIVFKNFESSDDEAKWIASEVKKNLSSDELRFQDILIILPSPIETRARGGMIARSLLEVGISAHIVGSGSSSSQVFQSNSVAITHVYRAKGNEAPMVYVADSQKCFGGLNVSIERNKLFTAMTRSKAWVRVSGIGPSMRKLEAEFNTITEKNYKLDFKYPTDEQLKTIRTRHKEVDEKRMHSQLQGLSELLPLFEAGRIDRSNLSEDDYEILRKIAQSVDFQ